MIFCRFRCVGQCSSSQSACIIRSHVVDTSVSTFVKVNISVGFYITRISRRSFGEHHIGAETVGKSTTFTRD